MAIDCTPLAVTLARCETYQGRNLHAVATRV